MNTEQAKLREANNRQADELRMLRAKLAKNHEETDGASSSESESPPHKKTKRSEIPPGVAEAIRRCGKKFVAMSYPWIPSSIFLKLRAESTGDGDDEEPETDDDEEVNRPGPNNEEIMTLVRQAVPSTLKRYLSEKYFGREV